MGADTGMSAGAGRWLLIGLVPLWLGIDLLQSRDKAVEEGNAQMKAGKAEQALGRYDDAVKRLPDDPGVHFNRGTALYGLSRWEEAAESFLRATEARTPDLKASAFYNLGSAFFRGKKYAEAVEAFKKTLAYDPGNERAKWNLELALRHRKEEEKQQKGDKNKQGDQQPQSEKKSDQQEKDPDSQAKNDPQKPEQEPGGDKDGAGPQKDPKAEENKDDPKAPEKQEKQTQADKSNQPDKQDDKQPGAGQKQEPDKPQAQKPPSKDKGAAGQAGNKGKQPPPEMQEVEAILDNLEKSPKALEQELARLRAIHRRPPAKDW